MEILQDESKPISARALVPEIVNKVDPSGFANIAKQMLDDQGLESEIAPYLAQGVASIELEEGEEDVQNIKEQILSLAEEGPDSFKKAAKLLTRPSKASPEP